ncbi:MAG: ornithine cyclodeaminase family protein, partial [Halobacteria archaeon]|nr:ornithine cyclodeaminase family protein [Halobacteria archaeon]
METLLFDPEDVEKSLDVSSAIDAVEDAFEAHATGGSVMPPKSYIDLPEHNGDFRAMPAYVDDSAGLKWVNSHPDNPEEHDLPSVMGVMVYSDPETAYPLAIIDGTSLTRYRTGAAAGVATRYLAHPDSESFGILGAGAQAHTQVDAVTSLSEVGIERVVV